MKLLLILLLIGLYSCNFDRLCNSPLIVTQATSVYQNRGNYQYNIQCKCGQDENNTIIYSDSLWNVGDTLKLVKQ
jgi:hypothetical protein